MKKRKGFIPITYEMIKGDPDERVLKALFSNFYPVHTELVKDGFPNEDILYYGYSEHFEEVEDGEKIPMYEAILKNVEGKGVYFHEMRKIG